MVPNVPALQMEEVLPIAMSKASTLAPQAIYAPKRTAEKVMLSLSPLFFAPLLTAPLITLGGERDDTRRQKA